MMSDLRGFTAIAERLQPEQVVQMLNTYFEVMVDLVLNYGTEEEITARPLCEHIRRSFGVVSS